MKMLTLHERSEWSERSEVKGIKKDIKNFTHPYMGGRVCVCLCVCLSVCVSILIKKLNNFWLNERILMKFSGSAQLLTSNFWAGVSD